ncbi:MAG: tRNA (adenosine(37)-N6)-threonylcarbamoyltransferase complex ATPase subunit type 1 TsaE [Chlamydiales bacterium]|nr:tRNA (adenosine(37)-N6)-threonylcarbamoyltransferase complex ATPase subunit type 1 TsaE [Chlamydiales bacterium]
MSASVQFATKNLEETIALGARLGRTLPINSVICLQGQLGAGKTQLVKGIVSGATGIPIQEVGSPTFVYLNTYQGPKHVYHFDLYRLHDVDEFLSMGFDEYFTAGGLCCIEWPDRITPIIPLDALTITLEPTAEDERLITFDRSMEW